jgi:hypothetical protein
MSSPRWLPALLVSLMLFSLLPLGQAGTAPMNGGPYLIETDALWDVDGQMNAQVVVKAGATLTIEAIIYVADGASLTVEEGATLRMTNATLAAEEGPTAVRPISISDETSLLARSSVSGGAFTLRIVAETGTMLDGWTVAWDEIPPQDMSGDVHEINFTSPKDDFRLNFDLPPGNIGDLVIASLQIVDITSSTVTTTPAIGSEPIDVFLAGAAGFPLNIHGTAHFDNSVIQGAVIDITGVLSMDDSALKASGPVQVHGNDASLDMQGGSISLSRVDHDIELDATAGITWGAAQGTGGLIDRWERTVSEQTIHIPVDGMDCLGGPCVRYIYHGVGSPNAGATSPRTADPEGNSLVPARTVEIGWADSTEVWTESATIEVETFRTAWNMGTEMDSWSQSIFVPLPYDVEVFEILPHLDHPIISVDNVDIPGDAGSIGATIPFSITVTNSGDETATVFIRCNIAGTETFADVTPKWTEVTLEASESQTVESRWTYHLEADQGLHCLVEQPTQFIDAAPFIAQAGVDSSREGVEGVATVEWVQSEESDLGMILLAVLVVSVILGLVFVVRLTQVNQGAEELRDVVDELEKQDAAMGRVDRFATMMDDDDEDDDDEDDDVIDIDD